MLIFRLFSKQRNTVLNYRTTRNVDHESSNNRLSWPQFCQRTRSTTAVNKNTEEERRRKSSQSGSPGQSAGLERLPPDEARAIQRANQIVM